MLPFGLQALFWAGALAGAGCPEHLDRVGSFQIQEISSGCMLLLSPLNEIGLRYRSFTFAGDGNLMVFNSFGPGAPSTKTGARVFYFFPRRDRPSYEASGDQRLLVHSASRLDVEFDSDSARIARIPQANFTESLSVSPNNRGGVEIEHFAGMALDCGFALGRIPQSDPAATSAFQDSLGHSCTVQNHELFKPESGSDEITFRYPDDDGLALFLQARCPMLETDWRK